MSKVPWSDATNGSKKQERTHDHAACALLRSSLAMEIEEAAICLDSIPSLKS